MKKFQLPFFLRKRAPKLAVLWLVLLILVAITGPLWMPWNPAYQDIESVFSGPTATHWLGTDDLGRDIFSRLFASGGYTLYASVYVVVVAVGLGMPAALFAAEHGKRAEGILSRISEIIFALPMTIMLLTLIGIVGQDHFEIVMIFLGFLIAPGLYRIMLAQTQSVRQRLYVDAARLNGLGSFRINIRHVLPALYRVLAVQIAMIFAISILMQAGLAFIGVGPQDPIPSWGGMIQDAQINIYNAPWLMVPPGVALILTVMAANELADAIGAGQFEKPKNILARVIKRVPVKAGEAEISTQATVESQALLSVRNLVVKVRDQHELVSGVSFDLKAGEVLGIVGESGCGKTISSLALLGLLPQNVEIASGEVVFENKNIARWTESELQSIRGSGTAFISQEPMVALDPMFTVQSQLVSPIRRLRKVSKSQANAIALDLLVKVGIPAPERVLKSYPHQLSGGMAQRVAIALALTGKPKLLIADEPTTALDVTIQAEILELLRSLLNELDMAMIVVTHNLGVVADIADQVVVMYAGQIVESGTVAEVLETPAHPYTAALLGADPHLPADAARPDRLATIPGSVPPPATWTNSCRFADRCAFATEVCRKPLEQTAAHKTGTVRCARTNELNLTHKHG